MVVPHTMKRRQPNNKVSGKKTKLNGNHGGFGPGVRFGPPAMMDRPFGPRPFPAGRPGVRFPPMPPMGFPMMGSPRRLPRPPGPPGPPMNLGPMMRSPWLPLGPRFMRRPPFQGPPVPPHGRYFPPVPGPLAFRNNAIQRKHLKFNKKRSSKEKGTTNNGLGIASEDNFLNDMSQPWITEEIRAENLKKRQLNKTARDAQSEAAWTIFKAQRNLCHDMVREARQKYLNTLSKEDTAASFQINPDSDGTRIDFTEDTLL